MITVGPWLEMLMAWSTGHIRLLKPSWTIFTTCWPGETLLRVMRPPHRAFETPGGEVLDHQQTDVGLKQRKAYLAHGVAGVRFGERPRPAQLAEDSVRFFVSESNNSERLPI